MSALRILLVDDDAAARAELRRTLAELGAAAVTEARSSAEALRMAREERPNIVISALSAPEMDGMAFINELARERLTDSVIVASAMAPGILKAVEAMAAASGIRVLGAVEKPLSREALEGLLQLHAHPSAPRAAGGAPAPDAAAVERATELGQFKPWYRPVLDVTSMRTVSAVVVPRWESPIHGTFEGDDDLDFLNGLPSAAAAMRAIVLAALDASGLWTQLGWNGVITLPPGVSMLHDAAYWDWLAGAVRHHGANGTIAISLNAAQFAAEPARGAFAVARAMVDGYYVSLRVQEPAELDALKKLAACHVVTCPVSWLDANASAMRALHDFASRMGAEIGVSGVDDAAVLGRLTGAGVRRAQGAAVGRPATAAETYDAHLARR
jgi:CheY-like chemotaxis protein